MPYDIEALRIRLKQIYLEEATNRRRIVFLKELPVSSQSSCTIQISRPQKEKVVKNERKTRKAIDFIEINYISKILQDMAPFRKALDSKNKRELSKLSVTLKLDIGKMYGIPGAYNKTEDPELASIVNKISLVRIGL